MNIKIPFKAATPMVHRFTSLYLPWPFLAALILVCFEE